MSLLAKSTVLITGASTGIGEGLAVRLAQEGAALVLAARSTDKLQAVAEAAKKAGARSVDIHTVDLTDKASTDKLAEDVGDKVDAIINNAGTVSCADLLEGPIDSWDELLTLNVNAPLRLTAHLARKWVKRSGPWKGTIINISSVAGIGPIPPAPVYAASKHAITGWTESIREALRPKGIKVMAVYPAYVASNMTSSVKDNDGNTVSPDKMIQPSDIAEACLLAWRMSSNALPSRIEVRNAIDVKSV